MPYLPLNLPPGVFAQGTPYQSKGRWRAAQLVRFIEQTIQAVGGWLPLSVTTGSIPSTEVIRALLGWTAKGFAAPVLAVGTNASIHTFTQSVLTDRSPSDLTAGGVNPVWASGGSYGSGPYGALGYGTGDPTQSSVIAPAMWSLDTFGDFLVGTLVPSDGRLLVWDGVADKMMTIADYCAAYSLTPTYPSSGTIPADLAGVVVTPERFLLALGVDGDGRSIRWPAQETLHDWAPTEVNTAGNLPLPGSGHLVCGRRGRGETLLWTDEDMFVLTYIGGTLTYALTQSGSKCGIVAPNAVAVMDGRAVWMGYESFYSYGGGAVTPVPSEVSDYVFSNFNRGQSAKCFARTVADRREVHFHYCSQNADEPDRYVIWNWLEDHWTPGTTARSAGIDRGAFPYPLCAKGVTIYEHEHGTAHTGEDAPWLESGPVEIMGFDIKSYARTAGEQTFDLSELIPDSADNAGVQSLQLRLYGRFYPDGAETPYGPFALTNPTPLRITARQVRVRLEEIVEGDWRLGVVRLKGDPGSKR